MDLFDFDQAGVPPFDLEDASSIACEVPEQEAQDCYESLMNDKSIYSSAIPGQQIVKLKLINNCEVDAILYDGAGDYPMFRARDPCDLCARNGMDCYLAKRGALITGCTTCISLYRECSFTHPPLPKGYMNTFPGIAEDEQVCVGLVTERKPAMASTAESRGRKTGARFPRDAVKILKQWLAEHHDHPYPNEREKDELKQLTGLKRSQIANWLANARRRGKVRPPSGPTSPLLGAIDIPSSKSCNREMADLDPMDRWKISPPENEPASMTAIARALTSTSGAPTRNSTASSRNNSRAGSRRASSEDDSTNFSMFRAPSVSSFGTRESSNSSLASSRSHRSRNSFASSQDRRRRRRAPVPQRAAAQINKSRNARIFQCTFCADSFPAKYDWQRHEKSLHLALERWICCPNGGTRIDALTGQPQCVFCPELNPSGDHLETHNFMSCQEKTMQEKTFYRKDHLRQHLKLMHGAKFDPHMESWKSTTTEIKSACGFCPSRFTTWQQRADHLAAHFKNGADMTGWCGNWGFEPHVEKLVENAVPPYLIGYERQTMVPYVAKAAPNQSPSDNTDGGLTFGTSVDETSERAEVDQITRDNNCWGRLEDELIKYVMEKKAQNIIPTDKEIQDQGRIIIYGDADPWDWTAADNQTWLDAFKFEHGIGPAPGDPILQETRTVPILPPYVVKGGLKTKRGQEAACPREPAIQERSCPLAESQPSSVPFTPDHSNGFDFDISQASAQGMDLDFDSIDFSGLDLNALGDMQMEGMGDAQLVTSAMDIGAQYAPVQPAGMMNLDPTFDVSGKTQQHNILENEPEMTLEAFDQLTGYTSSFRL